MNDERWLPVPGYEDRYLISDFGRVFSRARTIVYKDGRSYDRPGRLLKPVRNNNGGLYIGLGLTRDTFKQHRVASLVLAAFVGPRPEGMEVCHWDDDSENNRLTNLRYGTRSENLHDRVRNGRHHQANKTHCTNGHEFTPENTVTTREGHRHCRECMRLWKREYRSRDDRPHLRGIKHGRLVQRPLDPAKCGTEANYQAHRSRGQTPCAACRQANARASAESRKRKAAR